MMYARLNLILVLLVDNLYSKISTGVLAAPNIGVTATRHDPCQSRTDGLYPRYETQCTTYYSCENSTLLTESACPAGRLFDSGSNICRDRRDVTCRRPTCSRSRDGTDVVSGSTCRRYITCHSGINAVESMCPKGERLDIGSLTCASSNTTTCVEPLCSSRPDGFYSDLDTGCRVYFLCVSGEVRSTQRCPNQKVFNGKQCVHPRTYRCPKIPTLNSDCSGKKDGFHTNLEDRCRSYYNCSRGQKLANFFCPLGQAHDGSGCVQEELFQCNSPFTAEMRTPFAPLPVPPPLPLPSVSNYISRFSFFGFRPFNTFSGIFKKSHQRLNSCEGRRDGMYADVASDCNEYFYCRNEKLMLKYRCPQDLVFNGVRCDRSSSCGKKGQPSPECHGLKDGFHANTTTGCRSYFRCFDGVRTVFDCLPGKVFNGNVCVGSELYHCPATKGTGDASLCDDKHDGMYADPSSGCHLYQQCIGGSRASMYTCGQRRVFDGSRCVDDSQFSCQTLGRHTSPLLRADRPIVSLVDVCKNRTDGYHVDSDGEDCRHYFSCVNEEMQGFFSCRKGEAFDGRNCVSEGSFRCHGGTAAAVPTVCNEKPDGYHSDMSTGCKDYVYCRNNAEVGRFSCLENRIFNGVKCVKSSLYSCSPRRTGLDNSCSEDKDGFFQDFLSGCKKYYFCIGGRKTELECPENFVFNGDICVSSQSYWCPMSAVTTTTTASTLETRCHGRHDGYHTVPGSRCGRYYYCWKGRAVGEVRDCKEGARFDTRNNMCSVRTECREDT